jgi:predicted acylesterase/phospholipase RssA
MALGKREPTLGIALGGGGARGFAHIGVLKILEADGIRPQLMAGTSMGGVISALYASGFSANQIEEEAGKMANIGNIVKLLDSDISNWDHVINNENIQEYLTKLFKDKTDFRLADTAGSCRSGCDDGQGCCPAARQSAGSCQRDHGASRHRRTAAEGRHVPCGRWIVEQCTCGFGG